MPRGKGSFVILHPKKRIQVAFAPRGELFVAGLYPRDAVGCWPSDALRVYVRPSMKKKASKQGADGGKHLAAVESKYFDQLMALVEHCAMRQYDDGDPREVGWFTVKTSGAAWIIQVKDPDSGMSFQAIGETLDKALETAVLLLGCDEAPWESDPWLKRNKSKKAS